MKPIHCFFLMVCVWLKLLLSKCSKIVLFIDLYSLQSSSIDNPSSFNDGSKFNQGSIVSGVQMLKFKSK